MARGTQLRQRRVLELHDGVVQQLTVASMTLELDQHEKSREALLVALDNEGGVFNVGTGVETSVLELYDAIQRASGVTSEPAFAAARLGELQRSVLDISLAEHELGWRPGHSLDDGLTRTWAWIVQE